MSALQSCRILHAIFYDEILDFTGKKRAERISTREEWHKQAVDQLSELDVVFVDPDNGLVVPSAEGRPKENKYVKPDELLAYYAASDCFVFPSYREGFPNTVMEAGAMGLPSIVTDINGSREIINNGENGVIVPSKDVQALYDAMKNMIEAREEYKYMATNARPMIESRFEQGFVRSCLLDFYDEIMSN